MCWRISTIISLYSEKKSSIIDVKLEEPPLLSLGPVLSPSFGPLVPPPVRGNPPRPPPFILIGGCG
jgi:hypothetical protein